MKYTKNLIYIGTVLTVLVIFLAANRVKNTYTPYQMLVWELKANEGYRSWWYRDGVVRGKTAYSIGFGWNDQGNRRRHEIKKFTADKKVAFDEALEITLMEINKYGKLHNDPYKNLALQLYSYNCGLTKTGKKLGKCCKGKKGCGHYSSKVRQAHNRRRKFELALWNKDIPTIIKYTEENREKIKTKILPHI